MKKYTKKELKTFNDAINSRLYMELEKEKSSDDELIKIARRISQKFNGEITVEEILQRLKENGFRGLYIVDNARFNEIGDSTSIIIQSADSLVEVLGVYCPHTKTIIINEDVYRDNKELGEHELIHALIDGNLSLTIYEGYREEAKAGRGIEEGIAFGVELLRREDKGNMYINDYSRTISSYIRNNKCLRALNLLYESYPNRKYSSLIVLAIKEPQNFFKIIYDMFYMAYDKIVDQEYSLPQRDKDNFIMRIVYSILSFIDMHTENLKMTNDNITDDYLDKTLTLERNTYTIILATLGLLDENFRNGIYTQNQMSIIPTNTAKYFSKNELDRLLSAISGTDEYAKRQINLIEKNYDSSFEILDGMGNDGKTL